MTAILEGMIMGDHDIRQENFHLTRGFLEYSQHRGFITDPTRVRHPKDKPHVERGVQYVRERFFKGAKFTSLAEMRDEAA